MTGLKEQQTTEKAILCGRRKKLILDQDSTNLYRPISNLSFVSKLVERLVAKRLTGNSCQSTLLFPVQQSAYRSFHSTETAVFKIHNNLVRAVDDGRVFQHVVLDLSAAFDTATHRILLCVLSDLPQTAFPSITRSVPQGSAFGPLCFSAYTEDLAAVSYKHTQSTVHTCTQMTHNSTIA